MTEDETEGSWSLRRDRPRRGAASRDRSGPASGRPPWVVDIGGLGRGDPCPRPDGGPTRDRGDQRPADPPDRPMLPERQHKSAIASLLTLKFQTFDKPQILAG